MVLDASATPPAVVPLLDMIAANTEELPPFTIVFLIVLLVAPSVVDALPNQTTTDEVPVFVFSIVKLLSEAPLFEPSIVTLSAPFNLMIAEAEDPEIVGLTPAAGLIVNV